MKTTLKTLIMLAMVAFSGKALASDGMLLKVNKEQHLIVNVDNCESSAVLTLLDNQGVVIFKEQFPAEAKYSKVLNLMQLEDGKYLLELDKKYSKSVSTIIKKGKEVTVDSSEYSMIIKPTFKLEKEQLSMSISNGKGVKTEIEIYAPSGERLKKVSSKDYVVKKTFDFSNVRPGSYTVIVRTETGTFTETFNLI